MFHQDTFTRGYTLSLSYHRSEDRAAEEFHFDKNGFLVRPARIGTPRLHEVTANYLGLAGDGHLGKINVSHAAYYAFGTHKLILWSAIGVTSAVAVIVGVVRNRPRRKLPWVLVSSGSMVGPNSHNAVSLFSE